MKFSAPYRGWTFGRATPSLRPNPYAASSINPAGRQLSFAEICPDNRDQLFRALTGRTPPQVVFASGAAKSERWCQILSDVLGLPVVTPQVTEATALGCAAAASVGAGLHADLVEASAAMVKWGRSYDPFLEFETVYDDLRGKWQAAYAAQLALVDSGVTTSMWKAPGL